MPGLFGFENGVGSTPVVLLHGFGATHAAWDSVIPGLIGLRRVLVFDLPGHGRSLASAHGSSGVAARAVAEALDARGVGQVHWVGHSMGGAAAALAALRNPERAASLTLLAPGGFGAEINHRLLRRYAAARDEAEIGLLLEQFFGWEKDIPAGVAATEALRRRQPGAVAALTAIVETFFEGGRQKMLPVADLARLPVPVKVVWGTQDRVLPTRHAHGLPGRIAVHIFEGAGHMLPQEISDDVVQLILENTR